MSEKQAIVRDAVYYTGSSYICQLLGIITSVLIKWFLGPSLTGVWTALQVVLRYSTWSHLGIQSAAAREIPYFRGKGDEHEASSIRDTSFCFSLIMSCIAGAVIFIWSIIYGNKFPHHVVFGIRIISLIVVATAIYNFYLVALGGYKNFSFLSKLKIFNALITLILVVVLVPLFNIYGLFFAALFNVLLSIAYAVINTHYQIKFEIERARIFALLKIGVPLVFGGFAFTILMSIDKIMIIRMLGAEKLGFYTIATMGVTYAYTLPSNLNIVMFPRFQEKYSINDSVEDIKKYFLDIILVLSCMLPVLLGVLYFVVPVLVHYILPKFTPGIASFKILIIGCFFLSLTPTSTNFLITLNKQVRLAGITIITIFISILLNYYFIKVKGLGINGAAIGTCIGYFGYFTLLSVYSLAHFMKYRDMLHYFMKPFVAFIYLVAAILLLEYEINIQQVFLEGLVKSALLIIITLPILIWGNKKFGFSSHLKDAFNVRFRSGKA
jgi:O-antigen/teichoic acid export membrane protein